MNRRLLSFVILLLACAALAFYITYKPAPPVAPPVETPATPLEKAVEQPKVSQPPVEVDESEEEEELQTQTVRTQLQKDSLVNQKQMPDASISLKKQKAREIIPGVTLEDKELSIQLERANESLNIRRSKVSEEQVQMMWKQKF